MTDVSNIIREVEELKHFENINCSKCNDLVEYHCLEIQITCPKCDTRQKIRAFSGVGTEIYDVIDAILIWAGTGKKFEAVLNRHSIIQDELEVDKESENEKD